MVTNMRDEQVDSDLSHSGTSQPFRPGRAQLCTPAFFPIYRKVSGGRDEKMSHSGVENDKIHSQHAF